MKNLLLLSALLLLNSGCISSPEKMIKAFAKDDAAVNLELPTPWGMARIHRAMNTTNSVEVSKDGVSINKK